MNPGTSRGRFKKDVTLIGVSSTDEG